MSRIAAAIRRVVDGQDLERAEMHEIFGEVMDGKATDVQKSALLIALRMKGETPDEITGAAMAMRERVTPRWRAASAGARLATAVPEFVAAGCASVSASPDARSTGEEDSIRVQDGDRKAAL